MRRAGDQRAASEEARAAREDARHAEAMRALEALIGGMESRTEALIKGMETVIERTGR